MKTFFNSIMLLAFVAIMFSACSDNGDPVTPDPGPGASDHPVLWTYDMGFGNLTDIVPAVDDDDNVYFSIVDDSFTKVVAIGLDKNGNELWKQEFDGTVTGKAMYVDGRVIVSTGYPTAIYCLNPVSGAIQWSKNFTQDHGFSDNPSLAFANNKIYLLSYKDFEGYMVTYNLAGTELSYQQSKMGFDLTVFGNSLLFHDLDTLYSYNDNGAGFDFAWKWGFPATKNSRSLFTLYDIPLGDDGSIFIRDDEAIYIVSQSGQLTKTINLDASFASGFISNVAVSSSNDMILGNGDLVKINPDGTIEWESDIHDGAIINPAFTTAPVIASSGNMYDAQLFGLYSVKSNGTLNWQENAETGAGTEYGNLHPPVLTHTGDIISVSAEQSVVRCFKGDGQGLATGGWPKPFGDYGNTSSK